ncbi:hypothetical protein H9P43_008984 [Blastocladiella emersonii ATCC 22665]|nr:hypothetical protein H9P43_008984 [Blastocladiella emersonii ATCC 22665]
MTNTEAEILEVASGALYESILGAMWCPAESFRERRPVTSADAPAPAPAKNHARWLAFKGNDDAVVVVRALSPSDADDTEAKAELLVDLLSLAAFAVSHRQVVLIAGIAGDGANKNTLLVATPAGAGSLASLLRQWNEAGKERALSPATKANTGKTMSCDDGAAGPAALGQRISLKPSTTPLTPKLALLWVRDVLQAALIWHTRANTKLGGDRPMFLNRPLRISSSNVYISLPDLRAQLDVLYMCEPESHAADPENGPASELSGLAAVISEVQEAMFIDHNDPAAESIASELVSVILDLEFSAEDSDLVDVEPEIKNALAKVNELLG